MAYINGHEILFSIVGTVFAVEDKSARERRNNAWTQSDNTDNNSVGRNGNFYI